MRISDWSSDVCSSDLQAAAEDPVELADAGDPPRRVAGLAVELDEAQASAAAGLQALRCRRLDHLLDQGVPGAAGPALAGPFRLYRAAVMGTVGDARLRHDLRPQRRPNARQSDGW